MLGTDYTSFNTCDQRDEEHYSLATTLDHRSLKVVLSKNLVAGLNNPQTGDEKQWKDRRWHGHPQPWPLDPQSSTKHRLPTPQHLHNTKPRHFLLCLHKFLQASSTDVVISSQLGSSDGAHAWTLRKGHKKWRIINESATEKNNRYKSYPLWRCKEEN